MRLAGTAAIATGSDSGIGQAIAAELAGRGADVCVTCHTDDPDSRAEKTRHIPWKRAGRPEEVAKLAADLASTDADYVTGASFFIDGGLRMIVGQDA